MPLSPEAAACVQHAMERAAASTRQELARGLGSLALIGSVAPLLGGWVQVRLAIASYQGCAGWNCHWLVLDGFASSFLPLLLGLAIGIPAFIAYRQFTATVEALTAEMNGAMQLLAPCFRRTP
jgi:biopolymer transport protein ExbB/TolQ